MVPVNILGVIAPWILLAAVMASGILLTVRKTHL